MRHLILLSIPMALALQACLDFGPPAACTEGACYELTEPASSPHYRLILGGGALEASEGSRSGLIRYELIRELVLEHYTERQLTFPEILSVWTNFPAVGNPGWTLTLPAANDVTGVGKEFLIEGELTELVASPAPPLRAILFHNDFTQLDKRAERMGAGRDGIGYAQYIFLHEIFHVWGPSLKLEGGSTDLLNQYGLWSFWLDSKNSAAGGNRWNDNGDGTFSMAELSPRARVFAPLDLYVMGLIPPEEVPPLTLLVDVQAPPLAVDPLQGQALNQHTLPWFGPNSVRVTASTRSIPMDEIIAANGQRIPAYGTAATSWSFEAVLLIAKDTPPSEAARLAQQFEPFARSLPGVFADATGGRGTLVPMHR